MPARRHAGWPRTAAAFCQRRCPSPEGRHQQGDGGCEAHCECQPHQQEGGAASRVSCHSNEGLRSEVVEHVGLQGGAGQGGGRKAGRRYSGAWAGAGGRGRCGVGTAAAGGASFIASEQAQQGAAGTAGPADTNLHRASEQSVATEAQQSGKSSAVQQRAASGGMHAGGGIRAQVLRLQEGGQGWRPGGKAGRREGSSRVVGA